MLNALKSDFRKLLTVRSTHVMTGLALLIIAVLSFYFEGLGNRESAAANLAPTALKELIIYSIGMTAVFAGIVSILFMGHEYRYGTITYTLTANVRRSRVLLSKMLTISAFGLVFGALIISFSLACYFLGLQLRGASLPAQNFDVTVVIARALTYCVAYVLTCLLLSTLLRNIVATIAVFFIAPVTVEPLIGLALKDNAKYLPFTVLPDINESGIPGQVSLDPNPALIVFLVYLVVGWAITWWLFIKRDAN